MASEHYDNFVMKSSDGKTEYEVRIKEMPTIMGSRYETGFQVFVSYRGIDAWGRPYVRPKLMYVGEVMVSENGAEIMPYSLRNFLLMEEPGVWGRIVESIKRAIERK